jgi:plasmid stabilization system protein ParE
MAQKIIWSREAQDDFLATLAFYAERNGSKTYSEKLAGQIQKATDLL